MRSDEGKASESDAGFGSATGKKLQSKKVEEVTPSKLFVRSGDLLLAWEVTEAGRDRVASELPKWMEPARYL
jgi:hypothetical protein